MKHTEPERILVNRMPAKLYFAPMEGITTYVYRNVFARYFGGIDTYFTPFLANKRFGARERNDILPEHNRGIRVVPQILTNKADFFLAIAEQLSAYGYDEVNLNLGCPSGTVVNRRRGAGFLSVPDELDRFLCEIFAKSPLKISLKTRIGIRDLSEWDRLLQIYRQYPMTECIIHPRLREEYYSGTPHAEAFVRAAEVLKVPLCYNGNITDEAGCEAILNRVPNTNAVMIGRGALANPELPLRLKGVQTVFDPVRFRAFHDEILSGYIEEMSGEQPVLFKMKELWFHMASYVGATEEELKKVRKAESLTDYRIAVRALLDPDREKL